MEVILLERVGTLGQMGDVVRVKDGFARNFLLPQGKALRATKDNRSRFETMKVELEARNLEQQRRSREDRQASSTARTSRCCARRRKAASSTARSAARDIAMLIGDRRLHSRSRNQIALNAPIKTIGMHKVPVALHPEVEVTINVAVARNADEAERLARGEDITVVRTRRARRREAEALADAEKFFEPEAPGSARATRPTSAGRGTTK